MIARNEKAAIVRQAEAHWMAFPNTEVTDIAPFPVDTDAPVVTRKGMEYIGPGDRAIIPRASIEKYRMAAGI